MKYLALVLIMLVTLGIGCAAAPPPPVQTPAACYSTCRLEQARCEREARTTTEAARQCYPTSCLVACPGYLQ